MQALGSGFIIDPAGYIVTNNHVIRHADKITVTLQDNTVLTARAVGHDDRTDLALAESGKQEAAACRPFWGQRQAPGRGLGSGYWQPVWLVRHGHGRDYFLTRAQY
nr:trypsin-like peptidase domain-containing protein [Acetobacter malorum]